jgi:hypothetical protein
LETLKGYVLGLQSATTIALGIIALLPAAWVARIGTSIIYAIADAIVTLRGYLEMAELLFNPAIEWWIDNKTDLVCWFYNAPLQDPLSELVQDALFERLTEFWDGLGTDSITRSILWGLWTNVFFRESLFGLAINGIVPDEWLGQNAVDCSQCNPGGGTTAGDWVYSPVMVGAQTAISFNNIENPADPNDTSYGFHATGTITAGNQTSMEALFYLPEIDAQWSQLRAEWGAVTFEVTSAATVTGTPTLSYGGENHTISLCEYGETGGINPTRYCIKKTGQPTPPGTWHVINESSDVDRMQPMFRVTDYAYGPDPVNNFALQVTEWTFYLEVGD